MREALRGLDEDLAVLEPFANGLVERLRPARAEEIEISFGIALSFEASAVIVKGTAEANFIVTLRWKDAS